MLLIILAGVGAGVAHVLLGIDHLAAVLPLAHGRRLDAFRVGIRWGLGHSVGVTLVALSLLLLRDSAVAADALTGLAAWSERLVGLVLIGIGMITLRAVLREKVHVHRHRHEDHEHVHLHSHPVAAQGHQHQREAWFHGHGSVIAGVFQGVAGMSFLWGILPAMALPVVDALIYLLGFAGASIFTMALFAAGVGIASARLEDTLPGYIRQVRIMASLFCALVGAGWLVASS